MPTFAVMDDCTTSPFYVHSTNLLQSAQEQNFHLWCP